LFPLVFRQGPIPPSGHPNHTLNTCGDRLPSRAETLIPGGFAGLFGENQVVFLWNMRWISFPKTGMG